MIEDIEQVAERLSESLRKRGFQARSETIGGMGSLRVMADRQFVVAINNDRGMLSITLGRSPADKDVDRQSIVYWALCLGLRAVHGELPADKWPDDHETLELATNDATTTEMILSKFESLSDAQLHQAESCARRMQESYWRDLGLWPPPATGAVLRPRKKPSEQDNALAFRSVFSKDYEQER